METYDLPPATIIDAPARQDAQPMPLVRQLAARADGSGVPFSNTGRKVADQTLLHSGKSSFELDSEWVRIVTDGRRLFLEKTPLPDPQGVQGAALIDWLAFTVRPQSEHAHKWVIGELQRMKLLGTVEELRGGYAGYTNKAACQSDNTRLCLIAWGGKQQAGTVYVSFPGHGCARIPDWSPLQIWLEQHRATITRIDLAYDDFSGQDVSIRKAVEWYQDGGFGAGGRMPKHELLGDCLLGDAAQQGRTLKIGSRQSGKLARIYEKGKQLGDPASPWVRVEVEWHSESRRLEYEMLSRPGEYLSGAYKCLRFLHCQQSKVRTQQRAAKVSYKRAMENGRHLVGKLVNLALEVHQGDYAGVVEQLRREGYPARVEPFLDAVKDAPEMLAEEANTPHPTRGGKNGMSHLPATGFFRLKQIIGDSKANPPIPAIIPISKSTWWQGVKTGRFPAPVKIFGPRIAAWRVEDIYALMQAPSGGTGAP